MGNDPSELRVFWTQVRTGERTDRRSAAEHFLRLSRTLILWKYLALTLLAAKGMAASAAKEPRRWLLPL